MTDVSVLIPQYGQTDFTIRAVAAVRRSIGDLSIDIHVHDNGSPGGPGPVADELDVRLTRSPENLGFGPAMNQMAEAATGRFLLLLNNDTIVHPDAIRRMVDRATAESRCGAVVPLYRDFEGQPLELGGGLGEGGRAWQLFKGRTLPMGLVTTAHRADYGSAAAMLIARDVFLDFSGFDDVFAPAYYEDTDLCLRMAEQGLPTVVEPTAIVLHHEGGTAGTDVSHGLKAHQVRNRSTFVTRWGDRLADRGPVGLDRSVKAATEPAPGQPRILWLGPVLPRGDRDGGGRRTLEMLGALRAQGAGVAFYARAAQDPDRYGRELSALGIPWFGGPAATRWVGDRRVRSEYDDLGALLSAAPWDAVVMFTARFARRVLGQVREGAPDAAVIIDNADLHFLRHDRARELGIAITDPLTKDQELEAYLASDGVITSSAPEDEVLRREVEALDTHVFTVAPPEPRVLPPARDGSVLFLGNFGHPPNVDAVDYWHRDVGPRVSELVGRTVPLHIVGAATDGLPSGPLLDVVGWVPDLGPEFARARVFVAPLRYGAGTKGKLAEAMAYGVPVVTTPIGAEGFPPQVVDAMLIAEDADALARSTAQMLQDDDAWEQQRAAVADAARHFHGAHATAGARLSAWLLSRAVAARSGAPRPRLAEAGDPPQIEDQPFDRAAFPAVLQASEAPVFVVGAPRSGTSMMAHALGQHAQLWTGEESDFLAPLGRAAEEAWAFGRQRGDLHWLSSAGVSWDEFAAYLGFGMNALYASRSGGRRWVEQTPQYTLSLPLMARMFPSARFVYMLRDGRSVVHSLRHFVRPVEHEPAARLWNRFVRAAREFASSDDGDRFHVVRYEEVVADTDPEMRRICDFLEIPFERACAQFISERSPINSSFTDGRARPASPRWAAWTQEERAVFHARAGEMLIALGYEDDGSWVGRQTSDADSLAS